MAHFVTAMTVLAHCLGLRVVKERIETEEQLNFLRDMRCDEFQDYFVSNHFQPEILETGSHFMETPTVPSRR